MKKYLFLVFALFSGSAAFSQGYQVTVQAPQYRSGIAYLTYYMGSKYNIQDSAAVSSAGRVVFKGKTKLPGGVYVVFLPNKASRVDFLLDKEQLISISVPDTLAIGKAVITGSRENTLFREYSKFMEQHGKERQQELQAYQAAATKQDSVLHEKNISAINDQINTYRDNIIRTRSSSMMAALLSVMKEPSVPVAQPLTYDDSLKNYNYYKDHYWDGVTFMDDRIIRTPVFLPKLEKYYRDVVVAAPDVIKDIDYRLLLARNSPEMYKFLLNWLTDEYINPRYMGQDAIFVHLFEKYHSKGLSPWLNEKQMEAISRRAYMQMSNLVGEKAADLTMTDRNDKPVSLYDVNADYTLVCFWDPNCGHCKEELPRIDSFYQARWKQYNMKIFAVLSPDGKSGDAAKADWTSFIDAHHLGEGWINVYQTAKQQADEAASQKPGYKQLYDVIVTPTIVLLDKDKRIVAKKLSLTQLNDLLELKTKTKTQH